jgi:putative membrane protein
MTILLRWVVLAVAFGVTSWLLGGMEVSGGFGAYLWVSLIFGIVNAIVGTFIRLLTLPLTLITLGLFSLVINAFLLEITDALTDHLSIDDFFWTAIWAAVILAVVSVVLEVLVRMLLVRRADARPAASA